MNSSTGEKAKKIIKENEFNKKLDKGIYESIKELMDTDEFSKLPYNSRDKMAIISIAQKENMQNALNYEVDHLIPKSLLSSDNSKNIYNLQFKTSKDNGDKSDKFDKDQIKFDVFEDKYLPEEKRKIKEIFSKMNSTTINDEIFMEYIEIRKEIFLRKIQTNLSK